MGTADRERFTADAIRAGDRGYVAFHAPRFARVLELAEDLGAAKAGRILDIGRSRLTELLHERFGSPVDSLGFEPEGETLTGHHYHFDLNDAQSSDRWRRDLPRYDFIVMAEVIEHLYTAPELVLQFIRSLMADGGTVVIQTPNAASLPKRLKLLAGRNPYDMIRTNTTNPGHFREYTVPELTRLVRNAGLHVTHRECRWYFDARFAHHDPENLQYEPVVGRIKNWLYPLVPSFLQYGQIVAARREGAPGR